MNFPQPPEKLKVYFGVSSIFTWYSDFSTEIVVKNAKSHKFSSSIFRTSFHSFRTIFSYNVMPYNCRMLFCIKVSIRARVRYRTRTLGREPNWTRTRTWYFERNRTRTRTLGREPNRTWLFERNRTRTRTRTRTLSFLTPNLYSYFKCDM